MIYVVSGFMRSGTSMMMSALEAGGLEAVKNQVRDDLADSKADDNYHPNPAGLYELSQEDKSGREFPKQYDGKLIKLMAFFAPKWPLRRVLRMVFMRRDLEEIRQSFDAFFDRQLDMSGVPNMLDDVIERLHNRKDLISLTELNYREIVDNPLVYFKQLQEAGWPIDPEKAASVVDPSLCRFKLEELEIGIV